MQPHIIYFAGHMVIWSLQVGWSWRSTVSLIPLKCVYWVWNVESIYENISCVSGCGSMAFQEYDIMCFSTSGCFTPEKSSDPILILNTSLLFIRSPTQSLRPHSFYLGLSIHFWAEWPWGEMACPSLLSGYVFVTHTSLLWLSVQIV